MNHPSPTPLPARRQWSLDVLRIAATFSVVLFHALPLSQLEGQIGSPAWSAMNLLSNLCIWNVPVFFMISGALFLAPSRPVSTRRLYRRNILRMAASFLFFSAVYALAYCLRTGTGVWAFLIQLARGHYHMWYILKIVGLYALTPLLRQITQSKKATEYLLLAGLLFSVLVPHALDALLLFDLPHADFFSSVQDTYAQLNPYKGLYYVYYYILGHYLFAYPLGRRLRRVILACGAAGAALVTALTHWHSLATGSLSAAFNALSSPGVLSLSAAVFVLFTGALSGVSPAPRAQRVLLHLSGRAYGVYLVHALLLECLSPVFPSSAAGMTACTLAYSLLVYLAADLISTLLHRLPFLGKYIV